MNPKEIYPILKHVRRKLVKLAQERGSSETNLSGWCAYASRIIFHILKRRGLQPVFCSNWGHAFVMCDGWYMDVTATQFNFSYSKEKFPPIFLSQTPGHGNYHEKVYSTTEASDIYTKICNRWNQPIPLDNPVVQDMIENL